MSVRDDLAAGWAILVRDYLIFVSYRMRFLSEVISAALGVVLFYYVSRLVAGGVFETSDEYFSYAIIGLVVLQVVTASLVVLPMALRQELVAGTFERVLVSAFGPIPGLLAMSVFPFLAAVLSSAITIAVAAIAFGMHIEWSTVLLAIPAAVLGYLAFLPFAVVITATVFLVKQVSAGAGLIVACLSLVAGVLFPVVLLPDWIEWASEVQPLTPALDLLRHLVVGAPIDSTVAAVFKLVAFALVLLPFSIVALRAALVHAQRRGTVLEY
jgi:ABC-type uncharacterized transport system permease subunit